MLLLAKQDLINRDDDAPAVRVFLTSVRTHVVTIKKLLFACPFVRCTITTPTTLSTIAIFTIYTSTTVTIIILIMNLFIAITLTTLKKVQSRSGLIGCGGDLLERPCLAARPLKAHQYRHRAA